MDVMDTDPSDAVQFNERVVRVEHLAPLFGNRDKVGIGEVLTKFVGNILDRWMAENNISGECRAIIEGHRENLFRAPLGYPARPLDGYWSTGPFLHNGSVRTFYELLAPVNERAEKFWIGTREFDPYALGYRNDPVKGAFLFDTTQPGNSNKGHEFRDAPRGTPGVIGPFLTPEQRLDIIEYAKTMVTFTIAPEELTRRRAMLDVMAPNYEDDPGSVPYGARHENGAKNLNCDALVKIEQGLYK